MSRAPWTDRVLEHWSGSATPAIVDDDGEVSGDELLRLGAGAAAWFDEFGFVDEHGRPPPKYAKRS